MLILAVYVTDYDDSREVSAWIADMQVRLRAPARKKEERRNMLITPLPGRDEDFLLQKKK